MNTGAAATRHIISAFVAVSLFSEDAVDICQVFSVHIACLQSGALMQKGIATFKAATVGAVRSDWRPLTVCGLFIISSLTLLASKGINGFQTKSVVLNIQLTLTCIIFWIGLSFLWTLVKSRPDHPLQFAKDFAAQNLNPAVIGRHLPIVIALALFMPVFSAMKSSISLFADYHWDATFTRWDEIIHFGDAWRLIHPLVGYPLGTFILNLFYNFWIVVIYAVTLFLGLRTKNPELRERFLISYFLCWSLLGVAGAIGLASVGPAFVGPLLGQTHFDPQMQYLEDANTHYRIISVEVQAKLVSQFREGYAGLGAGITAMPSMHVSMVCLFFLALRHVSKLAAWLSGLFAAAIMVGSVHLAYHYAVDGYASIIATGLIWFAAGVVSKRPG